MVDVPFSHKDNMRLVEYIVDHTDVNEQHDFIEFYEIMVRQVRTRYPGSVFAFSPYAYTYDSREFHPELVGGYSQVYLGPTTLPIRMAPALHVLSKTIRPRRDPPSMR